jgi:hypothetical protein
MRTTERRLTIIYCPLGHRPEYDCNNKVLRGTTSRHPAGKTKVFSGKYLSQDKYSQQGAL